MVFSEKRGNELIWLAQEVQIGGIESHTLEWYLVWSTIVLAVVTLATAIVTGLLTWISWKTYKVEAEKTVNQTNKTIELANNSVDSMEHVAVTAIDSAARHRELRRLSRKNKKGMVE